MPSLIFYLDTWQVRHVVLGAEAVAEQPGAEPPRGGDPVRRRRGAQHGGWG